MTAAAVNVLVVLAPRKYVSAVAPSSVLAKYSPFGVMTAIESPPGKEDANFPHWLSTTRVSLASADSAGVWPPPQLASMPAQAIAVMRTRDESGFVSCFMRFGVSW